MSTHALEQRIAQLRNWQVHQASLRREFVFATFLDAIAFMARTAPLAEAMNHHPDWCNSYNKLVVTLRTHDVGAITALDVELAEQLDAAFAASSR